MKQGRRKKGAIDLIRIGELAIIIAIGAIVIVMLQQAQSGFFGTGSVMSDVIGQKGLQ